MNKHNAELLSSSDGIDWNEFGKQVLDSAIKAGVIFFTSIVALVITQEIPIEDALLPSGLSAALGFFVYLAGVRGIRAIRKRLK